MGRGGRVARKLQGRIAGAARHLFPRLAPADFYLSRVAFIPSCSAVTVTPSGDSYMYAAGDHEIYFPGPRLVGPLKLMSMQCYAQWLWDKYTMDGFVSVERGDVVVDCGAFVGGFSLAVQPVAKSVHAVEPAPPNFDSVVQNLSRYPNAHCWQLGFSDSSGIMPMNISSTYVDNSILAPDAGETIGRVDVQLKRIDEWMDEGGLDRIDFLKLEAEGLEPEIAESIGDADVLKIAADCGPERDGERTDKMVGDILRKRGYITRARGKMLFARKNP